QHYLEQPRASRGCRMGHHRPSAGTAADLDSEMVAPEILDQREDCVFLREHAGIRRRVGVRLNENPAWFGAMTFQFDERPRAIPEASLDLIQPVLPHLAKAVEMGRAFAQLRARYAAV